MISYYRSAWIDFERTRFNRNNELINEEKEINNGSNEKRGFLISYDATSRRLAFNDCQKTTKRWRTTHDAKRKRLMINK